MKDKIMAVLEQAVENGDAAGANVLVIHNGKEAVYCGYGMRDMENSLPMERDTIFRLYSQTFTCFLINLRIRLRFLNHISTDHTVKIRIYSGPD